MISTNLSTRPFYNERLVHLVLTVLVVVVAAVTVLNVVAIATLSRKDAALGTETARAERQAGEALRNAERLRRSLDPTQLKAVAAEANEANGIIERRTFSWIDLLASLEATLPPEVRVTSITPRIEKDGSMSVEMMVVGRTAEEINTFIEKLESRGSFKEILPQQQTVNPDGLLETILVGRYGRSGR